MYPSLSDLDAATVQQFPLNESLKVLGDDSFTTTVAACTSYEDKYIDSTVEVAWLVKIAIQLWYIF